MSSICQKKIGFQDLNWILHPSKKMLHHCIKFLLLPTKVLNTTTSKKSLFENRDSLLKEINVPKTTTVKIEGNQHLLLDNSKCKGFALPEIMTSEEQDKIKFFFLSEQIMQRSLEEKDDCVKNITYIHTHNLLDVFM